jgi:hypothetical protein
MQCGKNACNNECILYHAFLRCVSQFFLSPALRRMRTFLPGVSGLRCQSRVQLALPRTQMPEHPKLNPVYGVLLLLTNGQRSH